MKYHELVTTIDTASRQLLGHAAAAVNQSLVIRNWLIGAYIVEFEQNGEDRAKYGARLLPRLAADLKTREVGGTSPDMLERMRQVDVAYPQIGTEISAPVVRKFSPDITRLSARSVLHFSWTHLIELVRIDDPLKRAFYENECLKGNWSKRQLQRQIGSLLFERTGLSKNKAAVVKRARTQEPPETVIVQPPGAQTSPAKSAIVQAPLAQPARTASPNGQRSVAPCRVLAAQPHKAISLQRRGPAQT